MRRMFAFGGKVVKTPFLIGQKADRVFVNEALGRLKGGEKGNIRTIEGTERKPRIMPVHKSRFMFVPPFILENMARAGIKEARLTIQQSRISREKRAHGPTDMGIFVGVTRAIGRPQTHVAPAVVMPAQRQIYDSQNTWSQRVKLVRKEGDSVTDDKAVNEAYDHTGNFLDYLKKELNRESLDNNGMDVICNVHFGTEYNNAFWDGDEITLGDGDGKIFVNFSKSLDIVAHELGHGVVMCTANFVYENQPGALHEHFADVFGSLVTQHAEGKTADDADWLIGDEIMGPELEGEALRSMCAPGTAYDNGLLGKDPQPDHMKDYYDGPQDNGGVHINDGIMNKAFCQTAQEIGTDKAALIWYTALQKLWNTADFNDAVRQIVEAARVLTKDRKVEKGSPQKIRAAFKEVGLPTS